MFGASPDLRFSQSSQRRRAWTAFGAGRPEALQYEVAPGKSFYEEYFAFGMTSFHSASGTVYSDRRYRYNGKERDEETGLYYYGARYYAAWLGRWMAVDRPLPARVPTADQTLGDSHVPTQADTGIDNVYVYARNSPLTFLDPDGRDPKTLDATVRTPVFVTGQVVRPPAPTPLAPGHYAKGPETRYTRTQLYDELTRLAPDLSHGFKTLLVGQSFSEQGGSTHNWNIGGVEGGHAAHYTEPFTSMQITRQEYEADVALPEASRKYHNWTVGTPGRTNLRDQYNLGAQSIYAFGPAERPAYGSLAEGASAFLYQVERRVNLLKQSTDAGQRELAAKALGGDVNAYITLLASNLTVTNAQGETKTIQAYNLQYGNTTTGSPSPRQTLFSAIQAARAELDPTRGPPPPPPRGLQREP